VYYRGEREITNNKDTTILLPEYTSAFSNFTVQITPIIDEENIYSETSRQYVTSRVKNGSFTVYGRNGKFFWIVHGLRSQLNTEPLKSEVTVIGDGPYKYIV
jgi:hypothetical protein